MSSVSDGVSVNGEEGGEAFFLPLGSRGVSEGVEEGSATGREIVARRLRASAMMPRSMARCMRGICGISRTTIPESYISEQPSFLDPADTSVGIC